MFCYNLVVQQSPPILLQSQCPSKPRGMPVKVMSACCTECPISSKLEIKQVISGLAASILCLSQSNMAIAAGLLHYNNELQLANATESIPTLPLEKGNDGGGGKLMMMRGMTARDFDPIRYSGRWFEVASLKRGFAGQGQEDCHCTQGIYTFDMNAPAIQVDTFCVHGGPDGYITGIRGRVQCLSEEDKEKDETDLEKQEMIREKCYLRFPTLPFIPKEPYDVIATDYDNFALVSGAKDKSFIQMPPVFYADPMEAHIKLSVLESFRLRKHLSCLLYFVGKSKKEHYFMPPPRRRTMIYSRTPDPGPKFIEKYKNYLASFGYDPSQIKDTPQDCEVKSNSQLAAMMSMSGMQQALNNQFPDLELRAPVEFNPFTSVFDTLKKLVELYFKQR